MTVQLPAATSWPSAIAKLTNANTTAATKEPTATEYSRVRDFIWWRNLLKRRADQVWKFLAQICATPDPASHERRAESVQGRETATQS